MEAPSHPNTIELIFTNQVLDVIYRRADEFSKLSPSELDELRDKVEKRAIEHRRSDSAVKMGFIPISFIGRCEVMAYSRIQGALSEDSDEWKERVEHLWGKAYHLNTKSRFTGSLLEEFVGEGLETFTRFFSENYGVNISFHRNQLITGRFRSFEKARFKGFVSEVDFSFEFRPDDSGSNSDDSAGDSAESFELAVELKRKNKSPEFNGLNRLWFHDLFSVKFFALRFDRVWLMNTHPKNSFQAEYWLSPQERTAFIYELYDVLERWNSDEPHLRPNSWYCKYCDYGRSGKCPLLKAGFSPKDFTTQGFDWEWLNQSRTS